MTNFVRSGGRMAFAAASILLHVGSSIAQCDPHWDTGVGSLPGPVHGLAVFDDTSGPSLYASGFFGGEGVRKWNGTQWVSLNGAPSGGIRSLVVFDDGRGPALFVGGGFQSAGGLNNVGNIARWDGKTWSALGTGLNNEVKKLRVLDDGTGVGPRLFATGHFTSAGSSPANGIAAWNGRSWDYFGDGLNDDVWDAEVFDDGSGSGPHLFAAGQFTASGAIPIENFARWNGSNWEQVGGGTNARVFALAVFNDGKGPALYVGGEFTMAGDLPVGRIARWNGENWSSLGLGVDDRLRDLGVHDDGIQGPRLIATGRFQTVDGNPISDIASWSGKSWESLGQGIYGGDGGEKVLSCVLPNEASPSLVVGGEFNSVEGSPCSFIARWLNPVTPIVFGQQPESQQAVVGSPLLLSVEVTGPEDLEYQWRHNGAIVLDGGHVSGSHTTTLVVDPVAFADAGSYDVVVANRSCSTVSEAADVMVVNACTGDIDDSGTVDITDLLLIINLWGPCGGPPAICAYADIAPNGGNGLVNIDDLLAVIISWGPCP